MKILFSSECLLYQKSGHPESPERIRSTWDYLKKKEFTFSKPGPCSDQDILRVHSKNHLENIQKGSFLDSDTPVYPTIFKHASLAAGSAILASETALDGKTAFSLMRPPGHHSTRHQAMGFCYFNNIAIAIAKYLEQPPGKKAAILDIDCHHGNGTEDIFLGNHDVLYVSLHQSPLYPGTGLQSRDNCLNYPLPPRTGEFDYLKILETACKEISEFHPMLLGISAGFDTYREDPITQFGLEIVTYRKIGQMIADLEKPTFAVMEGGYSPKLPECVYEFIIGLDD